MTTTVTAFTATRAAAIEAAAIVSGVVNGSGHLILTDHAGNPHDAGLVKGADSTVPGPTGATGPQGPAGAVTWASMPAQLVLMVAYTGTAPARPTSRSDVSCLWVGPGGTPAGALSTDVFVSTG